MWTRKELKERAKSRFQTNYWKCILAALVLSIALANGSGGISNSFGNISTSKHNSNDISNSEEIIDSSTNSGFYHSFQNSKELADKVEDTMENIKEEVSAPLIGIAAVVFIIVFIILFAIFSCVRIFLLNPLSIGGYQFFVKNLREDAQLDELGAGFKGNYLKKVKIMFLRDLFTALWSMLFVIPGIIKAYEYAMIPFLLAQNPDMDTKEAFETSRRMMKGNKWKAFVLDLSFIGWKFLSLFTCGILSVFYVSPYIYQTDAALFEALSTGTPVSPIPDASESYIEVE